MTVPLTPVLAAATRLTHGDYDTTLASRQQREIDVQEVAGGLILLAARLDDAHDALRRVLSTYHERSTLSESELRKLPWRMKEIALEALAEGGR